MLQILYERETSMDEVLLILIFHQNAQICGRLIFRREFFCKSHFHSLSWMKKSSLKTYVWWLYLINPFTIVTDRIKMSENATR